MAWNEPGGNSGGKRNPWGGNRPDQGPPDLDEVLRNLQRRLSALFGGSGGRGPTGTTTGGSGSRGFGLGTIVIILVVVWALTGFYQVDAAERGLVFRFGKHVETTMPGPRWHLPWPIETKQLVNVQSISSYNDKTRMLTADENLVEIDMEVQFRRTNPLDYAFNVRSPDKTLEEVSESAIREIVGRSMLDHVLESGRQEIAERTKDLIQRTLDAYKTGIEVTTVNLQDVRVPGEVRPAQEDAIRAREDRERASSEAQAYANDRIPRARGEAVRRIQDAQAYRAAKIAEAEGESLLARGEHLFDGLQVQPLASSKKVVIDSRGSGNLLYLPIDKLLEQQQRRTSTSEQIESTMTVERPSVTTTPASQNRTRGSR
jgi:membrane protease subunit HflK